MRGISSIRSRAGRAGRALARGSSPAWPTQLEVHRRAQVVGVGDEHVLEALGDQRVQRARAHLVRVKVRVRVRG